MDVTANYIWDTAALVCLATSSREIAFRGLG